MRSLYILFFVALGLTAGMFAGAGNVQGYLGAVLPGIIVGLIASGPLIRQRLWSRVGIVVASALLGSLAAAALPDNNGFKSFCREQSNLHVQVGSYEFGRAPSDK